MAISIIMALAMAMASFSCVLSRALALHVYIQIAVKFHAQIISMVAYGSCVPFLVGFAVRDRLLVNQIENS